MKGSAKGSGLALPAGTGPATAGRPADPQAQGAPGWGVLSDSFGLQGMAALPLLLLFLVLCFVSFLSSSFFFFDVAGQACQTPSAFETDNQATCKTLYRLYLVSCIECIDIHVSS